MEIVDDENEASEWRQKYWLLELYLPFDLTLRLACALAHLRSDAGILANDRRLPGQRPKLLTLYGMSQVLR